MERSSMIIKVSISLLLFVTLLALLNIVSINKSKMILESEEMTLENSTVEETHEYYTYKFHFEGLNPIPSTTIENLESSEITYKVDELDYEVEDNEEDTYEKQSEYTYDMDYEEKNTEESVHSEEDHDYNYIYSPKYFKEAGRISWGDWSWTWYSEKILPGYGLRIPGRHTDELGYVRDENEYLCLASDVLDKGTIVDTPFGSPGIVYDCGCGNNYTMDVYVGW